MLIIFNFLSSQGLPPTVSSYRTSNLNPNPNLLLLYERLVNLILSPSLTIMLTIFNFLFLTGFASRERERERAEREREREREQSKNHAYHIRFSFPYRVCLALCLHTGHQMRDLGLGVRLGLRLRFMLLGFFS
jgi:hypothetical protein